MRFLNLSKVHPLDVLLTAEDTHSSRGIRAMQEIRFSKPTRFSHASLFLAPSVIVESDDPGTVVTNLCKVVPDSTPAYAPNLRCRLVGRELSIFVGLPEKSDVEVVRPRAAQELNAREIEAGRSSVLDALLPAYLARYSNVFHLLSASGWVPRAIQAYIEEALSEDEFQRGSVLEPRTRTFCSELVSMLLASAMELTPRSHAHTVPGHFEWEDQEFVRQSDVVFKGEEELPGTDCPEVTRNATALLRTHLDSHQATLKKILGLAESRLVNDPNLAMSLRADLSHQLGSELIWIDAFWDWVASLNHCASVCPGGSDWDVALRMKCANSQHVLRNGHLQPIGYPSQACDQALLPRSCIVYGSGLDRLHEDWLRT